MAETINLDGMHTFVPAMCPNCNAHMKVDTSYKIARCNTCGTECLVQDAIKTLTIKGNVQVGNATINVSGTPSGTVSQPTFTGNEMEITVTGTPSGSVAVDQEVTTINQVSDVGATPTMRTYIENGTLKFSFNPGSAPTLSDLAIATKVSNATFTGNELTSNGTVTPSGTVSKPTFTGDELISNGDYTPSGDVSKPMFSGETETITSK